MKTYSRFKINFMKMKMLLSTLTTFALFLVVLFAGCREDEFVEVVGVCPLVMATDPVNGFNSAPYEKNLTATFNEKMNPSTITSSSFLLQLGPVFLAGTVSYVDSTALFKPTVPLLPLTTYTATIKKTVRDVRGNFMQYDYVWTFTTMPYLTLLPLPVLGGVVTGAGAYAIGSTVTASATPNSLYTFTNWTDNGLEVSNSSSYQFLMTGNKILTANFSPVVAGKLAVNLSSSPAAGGISTGQGSYSAGEMVTVNAYPNSLYIFDNWTESGVIVSSSSNYQFNLTANRTLVANYSLIPVSQFALILSSSPKVGGTTNGSGAFSALTIVTIIATSNTGYNFVNWTEGGVVISTLTNFTFQIKANRALVANYTPIVYSVGVSSLPILGGITSGGGSFNSGTSVTVTAVPNVGFKFTNWTEGATVVSTNVNYQFNINGNRILVANYSANIPPLATIAINLGCTSTFSILAGSTITSTGPTIINGDIGLSAGTALVGFPPGIINGTQQITTPDAASAKICLTSAFVDGQSRSLNSVSLPGQLGGLTLAPGLYTNSSTSGISGTGANGILTLDAQGNANAVWIFLIGSTLTTDPATSIVLAGGAKAKNIFWIVGTSATLGTTSVFYGNILADQSISLKTGSVLNGRALARIGAVSLDACIVNIPQ